MYNRILISLLSAVIAGTILVPASSLYFPMAMPYLIASSVLIGVFTFLIMNNRKEHEKTVASILYSLDAKNEAFLNMLEKIAGNLTILSETQKNTSDDLNRSFSDIQNCITKNIESQSHLIIEGLSRLENINREITPLVKEEFHMLESSIKINISNSAEQIKNLADMVKGLMGKQIAQNEVISSEIRTLDSRLEKISNNQNDSNQKFHKNIETFIDKNSDIQSDLSNRISDSERIMENLKNLVEQQETVVEKVIKDISLNIIQGNRSIETSRKNDNRTFLDEFERNFKALEEKFTEIPDQFQETVEELRETLESLNLSLGDMSGRIEGIKQYADLLTELSEAEKVIMTNFDKKWIK